MSDREPTRLHAPPVPSDERREGGACSEHYLRQVAISRRRQGSLASQESQRHHRHLPTSRKP